MLKTILHYAKVLGYPQKALQEITDFYNNSVNIDELKNIAGLLNENNEDYLKAVNYLFELESKNKEYCYMLANLALLYALKRSEEHYKATGNHQFFVKNFSDLRNKTEECKDCYGIYGIFAFSWYRRFFDISLFYLGRLQFCVDKYCHEPTEVDGIKINKDDLLIFVHIPSSGPLKPEDCINSYMLAYKHFCNENNKKIVFACSSWLLNPNHKEMLPNTNITAFMEQFKIVHTHVQEDNHDAWRIFGSYANLPIEDFPENSSLQRAYKKWLLNGNKFLYCTGIFAFDGKTIFNDK